MAPPSDLLADEAVLLVPEEDVERGERAVAAGHVLLHLDLLRVGQLLVRVDPLLEHAEPVADHHDLVEEGVEGDLLRRRPGIAGLQHDRASLPLRREPDLGLLLGQRLADRLRELLAGHVGQLLGKRGGRRELGRRSGGAMHERARRARDAAAGGDVRRGGGDGGVAREVALAGGCGAGEVAGAHAEAAGADGASVVLADRPPQPAAPALPGAVGAPGVHRQLLPPARRAATAATSRSTTSGSGTPEVSTTSASAAGLSGATARSESWRSRRS